MSGIRSAPPVALTSTIAPAVGLVRRHAFRAALAALLAVGGWLRWSGANWDQGGHLHPDERYITMVADAVHWPGLLEGYFDVDGSPLSPYNTEVGRGYVYGTLPLFATKAVGALLGGGGGYELNILGRHLSAILDSATIVLVFLIARLVLARFGPGRARTGALLAAGSYAFAVTAIQNAHFFTTDSWLVFFGTLTFYLAARAVRAIAPPDGGRQRAVAFVLVGASLGLTIACKASGAVFALPVLVAAAGSSFLIARTDGRSEAGVHFALSCLSALVAAYVTFRAVSPYSFARSSWFDVTVSPDFRAALETQRQALAGAFLYPPGYQWLLSPRYWDPLKNLVVWQLGVPLGLAMLGGFGLLAAHWAKAAVPFVARSASRPRLPRAAIADATLAAMLVTLVVALYVWVGSRFAHTGRYLLPIVPVLCVAAGYGLVALAGRRPRLLAGLACVVVGASALYAVAFHSVYRSENTRIAASDWLVANLQPGSTIVNEHWDDSLPVGGRAAAYRGVVLAVFDPDDGEKVRKLYDGLANADAYILSSPRAWRTIGRLPDRFPLMTRFYAELFAGRLGFVEAASFSSPPRLGGLRLDDLRAEEAFWVYDHPNVRIMRPAGRQSFAAFRRALCPVAEPPACA